MAGLGRLAGHPAADVPRGPRRRHRARRRPSRAVPDPAAGPGPARGRSASGRARACPTPSVRTTCIPTPSPPSRASERAGYRVGVAGNQPQAAEALFRGLDVPLDLVASSETLGVEKPDPRFFAAIAERLALTPARSRTSGTAWTTTSGPRPRPACARSSCVAARGHGSRRAGTRCRRRRRRSTTWRRSSRWSAGSPRARRRATGRRGRGGPAEDAHLRLRRGLGDLEAQQAIRHLGEVLA